MLHATRARKACSVSTQPNPHAACALLMHSALASMRFGLWQGFGSQHHSQYKYTGEFVVCLVQWHNNILRFLCWLYRL
jgi:hypothetical protein